MKFRMMQWNEIPGSVYSCAITFLKEGKKKRKYKKRIERLRLVVSGGRRGTSESVVQGSDREKNCKSETPGQCVVLLLSGDRRPLSEPQDLNISQEVWVLVSAWDSAKCCYHFQIFGAVQSNV